jgi:hypothetical protein
MLLSLQLFQNVAMAATGRRDCPSQRGCNLADAARLAGLAPGRPGGPEIRKCHFQGLFVKALRRFAPETPHCLVLKVNTP